MLRQASPQGPSAASTDTALSNPPVIVTAIWAVVVILCTFGQPFLLGFYTDDWPECVTAAQAGAPFSKALLQYVFSIDPSRPGLLPFRFLFSSLFADRVFLWHSGLVFANCLVALVLVGLIGSLTGERIKSSPVAIWIGLCWLLLPWNTAAQFWPTFLPNDLVLVAFGLFCAILLRGWKQHKHNALLAGAMYLWICLGYEVFYFQWITLALLGLALSRDGWARLGDVAYSTTALIIAQAAAVIWHLYATRLVGTGLVGQERPIASHWYRILFGDLLTTIPSMFRSFGDAGLPFAVVALVLGGIWLIDCYKSVQSTELRQATRTSIRLAGCCLVGGVLSIFAFALGGRGLNATGPATRTLVVFNFWLVVTVGICVAGLLGRANRSLRVTKMVVLASLGITLAAGHVLRLADWATAWRLQTKILAEAPLQDLRNTPAGTKILLINRLSVNGAPIFTAPWDLNAAMPWKYPFLQGRVFLVYYPMQGTLTWDTQRLSYQGDFPVEAASHLYIWRPTERSFSKARGPFRVLPNLAIENLRTETGSP